MSDLKQIITNLLKFQYEHLGYGELRCKSCGSYAWLDYDDGRTHPMNEECSPGCPWRQAREAVK